MWVRALAFVVWAAAAASVAYWGSKLFVQPLGPPPQTTLAVAAPPAAGDLTRLFGAEVKPVVEVAAAPVQPVIDTRFRLLGVVAPRRSDGSGVALIAVDGKPPKAYRVGAVVEGERVLQAVQPRGATLGPRGGAAQVSLQLPPPPAAAGGLPPGLAGVPPGAVGLSPSASGLSPSAGGLSPSAGGGHAVMNPPPVLGSPGAGPMIPGATVPGMNLPLPSGARPLPPQGQNEPVADGEVANPPEVPPPVRRRNPLSAQR